MPLCVWAATVAALPAKLDLAAVHGHVRLMLTVLHFEAVEKSKQLFKEKTVLF